MLCCFVLDRHVALASGLYIARSPLERHRKAIRSDFIRKCHPRTDTSIRWWFQTLLISPCFRIYSRSLLIPTDVKTWSIVRTIEAIFWKEAPKVRQVFFSWTFGVLLECIVEVLWKIVHILSKETQTSELFHLFSSFPPFCWCQHQY